jgi:hypothetical protein
VDGCPKKELYLVVDHNVLVPTLIDKPKRVTAAGNKIKVIEEYIGRVNTNETRLSVALMNSPAGWEEPGQRSEFDEYTLVLEGSVEAKAGEWVRYRTPVTVHGVLLFGYGGGVNSSRKTGADPGAILFESPQRPRAGSSGTASTILAGPPGALGFTGELAADLFDA